MLIYAGVEKIHICAPSNAAVDEILSRIGSKGLIGVTKEPADLKKLLLRVGATEHDPPPTVKPFTLDTRLNDVLSEAKGYELREQINCADNLIMELAAGNKLSTNKHLSYLQKCLGINPKKAKHFMERGEAEITKALKSCMERAQSLLEEVLRAQGKGEKVKGDWQYAQSSLILRTPLLFTTLSTAGIDRLEVCRDAVDYLIIDEAC